MKFIKKLLNIPQKNKLEKSSVFSRISSRMNTIGRNMSRGAFNRLKTMKNNSKWGNWGGKQKKNHHES